MAGRLWKGFTYVIVGLAALTALLLAGSRLLGFRLFTVLSGSMEPVIPTGALIFVKPVEPQTICEGQIITFLLDENTVATHRVTEILPDGEDPEVLRFRTRGDANTAEDGSPVHCKNVLGTPVLTIPTAGRWMHAVQTPPGRYLAVTGAVIFLILLFLPDALRAAEEADARNKKTGDIA